MIVLNVAYKCRPGMREAFLERIMAEGIDIACRADAGSSLPARFGNSQSPARRPFPGRFRTANLLSSLAFALPKKAVVQLEAASQERSPGPLADFREGDNCYVCRKTMRIRDWREPNLHGTSA